MTRGGCRALPTMHAAVLVAAGISVYSQVSTCGPDPTPSTKTYPRSTCPFRSCPSRVTVVDPRSVCGNPTLAVTLTGIFSLKTKGLFGSFATETPIGPRMVGTVPEACLSEPGCGCIKTLPNPGLRGRTPNTYREMMLAGEVPQA